MNRAYGENVKTPDGFRMVLKCKEPYEKFLMLCNALLSREDVGTERWESIRYFKQSIGVSTENTEVFWDTPFENFSPSVHDAIRRIGIQAWEILLETGYDPTEYGPKTSQMSRYDEGVPPCLTTILDINKNRGRIILQVGHETMKPTQHIPKTSEEDAIRILNLISAKIPVPKNKICVDVLYRQALINGFYDLARIALRYINWPERGPEDCDRVFFVDLMGESSLQRKAYIDKLLREGVRDHAPLRATEHMQKIFGGHSGECMKPWDEFECYVRFGANPNAPCPNAEIYYYSQLLLPPHFAVLPEFQHFTLTPGGRAIPWSELSQVPSDKTYAEKLVSYYEKPAVETLIRLSVQYGITINCSNMDESVQSAIATAIAEKQKMDEDQVMTVE